MEFEEKIPRKYFTKEEMLKRVARFDEIEGSDGGLPDSYHPSAIRTLFNVIGFQPPKGENDGVGVQWTQPTERQQRWQVGGPKSQLQCDDDANQHADDAE